jgi:hypothetical protein
MNYTRIVLAAVVATIVDLAYGFVVYGNLLAGSFVNFPGVYRPMDAQLAYMPALCGGILIAMLAGATIYAKGYEGGRGATEGARFGFLMAFVAIGYSVIVNYATMNLGRRHTLMMGAASLAEWILAGMVIGLMYKPVGAPTRASARV